MFGHGLERRRKEEGLNAFQSHFSQYIFPPHPPAKPTDVSDTFSSFSFSPQPTNPRMMIPKVKVGKNSFSERERDKYFANLRILRVGGKGRKEEEPVWRNGLGDFHSPRIYERRRGGGRKWEFLAANGFRSSSLGLVGSFLATRLTSDSRANAHVQKKKIRFQGLSCLGISQFTHLPCPKKELQGKKEGGGGLQTDRSKKVSIYGS